ncbi:class I SAM-dependent methyltransferase [Ovoidimarina sediminis]|uniref:class I SAM-dependent methyltransferase n=1 Tax=Ovoidimarina sediminis TaxID=3079856 RepID=UPI002909B612|nr:class I SAM-dependent methyltransferase [Rhodophyticola sp. MJ-SS7]MDU8944718.1 class I SAM-dependent methyltransferase [Rhodophyticola sp. MJ-SS7]
MSRLDSVIRRLVAQRDILNHVAAVLGVPETGAILEIGLGNGRTYSHLRELFPGRRIVAFDRALAAHKSSVPDEGDLVLGEIAETAQGFVGGAAALAHADIGTAYDEIDAATVIWLAPLMAGVLAEGGIAVSGLPLKDARLAPLPVPEGIAPDRYFLYRRVVGGG